MTTQTTGKNEKIEIPVSGRLTGKHHVRGLRVQGRVPAILYGPKVENQNLLTEEITLKKYSGHKYESTIFQLKSDDPKLNKLNVLLRDVQVHPVTRRPVHVDLFAVDMSSTIRVNVEIRFDGKPAGLAEGGVLQTVLRELEVECLPSDIPEFILADVSSLGLGDALHVSDLKMPDNVKVMSGLALTLATVNVPAEEPVAVAATAAPVDGAVPAAGGAAAATPAAGAAATPAAPAAGGDKKK
jgi:large subunit ribosomal protein L25